MNLETLNMLLKALPDNSIADIMRVTGKSKTTIYNVLQRGLHKNKAIVTAAIEIVESKALNDLKLISQARKEQKEDEKLSNIPKKKQAA